jgi:hypothetical protein
VNLPKLSASLVRVSLVVIRTNSVNDVLGGKITSGSRLHVPGLAPAPTFIRREFKAQFLQRWPCGAVDGPIYATTAREFHVCSVNDRASVLINDVSQNKFNSAMFELTHLNSVRRRTGKKFNSLT